MNARYYDPEIKRFISKDPLAGYINYPQTQNPYSYAVNNPLSFSDTSGLLTFGLCSGYGAAATGLYGDCIRCLVTDFRGIGRTTKYTYGGTSAVGGGNLFFGFDVSASTSVDQLAGLTTIGGGSVRYGPGVSADTNLDGPIGVSAGFSPGFEPSYAAPAEIHAGREYTQVNSYKSFSDITPNDVVNFIGGAIFTEPVWWHSR